MACVRAYERKVAYIHKKFKIFIIHNNRAIHKFQNFRNRVTLLMFSLYLVMSIIIVLSSFIFISPFKPFIISQKARKTMICASEENHLDVKHITFVSSNSLKISEVSLNNKPFNSLWSLTIRINLYSFSNFYFLISTFSYWCHYRSNRF